MKPISLTKNLVAAAVALLALNAQAVVIDGNTYTCTGSCGQLGADGNVTAPDGQYGYVTTSGSNVFFGVTPQQVSDSKVSTGNGTSNGSKLVSSVFSTAGGAFSASFNYVSTDGNGFDDYSWARVIDATNDNPVNNTVAWLFTARSTNSGTQQIVPGNLAFSVPTSTITNYASYNFTQLDGSNGQFVNWSALGAAAPGGLNGTGTCWETKKSNGGCGFTGWLDASVNLAAGNYRLEVGVMNFGDTLYDSGLAFNVPALAAPVPETGTAPMMLAALGAFGFLARRRMNRSA
ncbi:hypothetical protein BurJ1DRAFT_0014 [Burkholderiales bacterium JOSHI_001]|nr:hypothetical protein BurJ1DRAFT_0014 [Burkholderiales bacterium JOSHI_001]